MLMEAQSEAHRLDELGKQGYDPNVVMDDDDSDSVLEAARKRAIQLTVVQ